MRVLYNAKRNVDRLDAQIASVAAGQHGVFGRSQVVALGVGSEAIRWRLRTGRWEPVFPKVYGLAGAPETWSQRVMAGCLHWSPDATASHRAAAKLRGMCRLRHARVELSVARGRNRAASRAVVVHRTAEPIPAEDIAPVDGIPATRPARTLLDLAATESERTTARFVDDALRRRLVSLTFLDRWLADPCRKQHRGAARLCRLMEERMIRGVTGSQLESDALALLRAARLPMPMLQYRLEDERGRVVARLDLAYPEQRIGIELDGFAFHDTRDSFDSERARGNELQALGWNVMRVTSRHLEVEPERVRSWIRRTIGG